MSNSICKALIVPGLPHLVLGESSKWNELKQAYKEAGESLREANPDAIVYFSTQAVGVLGNYVQALPNPKGIRVDENWYQLGEIPFDFPIDTKLAHSISSALNDKGIQSKPLHYEHYPIDTGTLVAQSFLNPDSKIPSTIIACNIYATREVEENIGKTVAEVAEKLGKRVAVVAVTGLSQGFYNFDIDVEEDSVNEEQDEWNRKMLDLISSADTERTSSFVSEYAENARADMQFKAFHWLMGAINHSKTPPKVRAYGPIWGSGAAVIEW